MPTPSETRHGGEWTPRTDAPRRSVFGNYRADPAAVGPVGVEHDLPETSVDPGSGAPLEKDRTLARAFIYRWLAKAFEDPTPAGWEWLGNHEIQESLRGAMAALDLATVLPAGCEQGRFVSFHTAYLAAFGHAARGVCPLNEIEYGDLKADPLFQPHRLADLAAFYRAFGLEITEDAGERQDHLCLELEFMCVLAAKEAYALEHQLDAALRAQCRDAQKKFLREHLGRWVPAFSRRLVATTPEPFLLGLAQFIRGFVEAECGRLRVRPGSEDLQLRPVDDTLESLCGSCGLASLPPGA